MPTVLCILLTLVALALLGWVVALHRAKASWRRDRQLQSERSRQLHERLAVVDRRRSELEAVLSSMVEGVAFIDTDERLVSLNHAAAQLLSLDPERAIGRPIQEVVRNVALQSLVAGALGTRSLEAHHGELTVRLSPGSSADDRYLQAHAAPVRDAEGQRVGAVVVLHDITRLRRLESVRRDFVANVSHEIKTPISAIKAAIETLIDDPAMPAVPRGRFTSIIARQTDRLDHIVEDLLSLTRLEQEGRQNASELEAHALRPVIDAACETCHANAQAKSIELVREAEAVWVRAVPTLLEQALVNLIDNAIKYSPDQTTVRIAAQRRGHEVVICVTDHGRGIEAEHLPRVFERFYRTDRARSRSLGGTGLGLSIVKHVAEVHGGRAGVQSSPGRGSTFSLYLQAATAPDSTTDNVPDTAPSRTDASDAEGTVDPEA